MHRPFETLYAPCGQDRMILLDGLLRDDPIDALGHSLECEFPGLGPKPHAGRPTEGFCDGSAGRKRGQPEVRLGIYARLLPFAADQHHTGPEAARKKSQSDAKGTGTHNAQVRRLGHEANPPQALKNVIVMVTYGSVDNRAETLPFPPAAALT